MFLILVCCSLQLNISIFEPFIVYFMSEHNIEINFQITCKLLKSIIYIGHHVIQQQSCINQTRFNVLCMVLVSKRNKSLMHVGIGSRFLGLLHNITIKYLLGGFMNTRDQILGVHKKGDKKYITNSIQ